MTKPSNPLLAVALLAPPWIAACAPAPDAGREGAPAPAQPPETVHRIEVPPTVRRNLGITFAKVAVRHVEQTIRVPGAFELQPLARHEYRMALPGQVEVHVDQYDRVEPGQLLYRYRSPAWPELEHEILLGEQGMASARAEIAVARARLAEAERKLALARERIAALAQADFKKVDLEVDAAELEASLPRLEAELGLAETRRANAGRTRAHALRRAATAAGIAVAELEADPGDEGAAAYRSIDWIEVRAVEPGVVEALGVTDGAFVEPPTSVLATVDPELVRFRALALQADLPRLAGAHGARIVPPPSPAIPVEEGVAATMTIGLEAHPLERTVTLIAVPERRAAWIRPGVAAFLEVVVATTESPALAVPRSAVLQDGLVHVFFRRDPADPNAVLRVEADLGPSDGTWVVLQSGVMAGDEVVLAGAYELKLATQQSGVRTGGHVHADGTVHDDP